MGNTRVNGYGYGYGYYPGTDFVYPNNSGYYPGTLWSAQNFGYGYGYGYGYKDFKMGIYPPGTGIMVSFTRTRDHCTRVFGYVEI